MSTPSDPYQTPDESNQDAANPAAPWSGPAGGNDQPAGYGSQMPPAAPPVGGYPQGYQQPQQQKSSGLAITSMVLGIVGVIFSWFLFGIPSILAVIFGHVGLSKVKNGTGDGRGMAIAGLTMGWIVVGIYLILLAVGAAFVAGA